MKRLFLIWMVLIFPVVGLCDETDYYTSTTARVQVRALVGESTASFWTDAEIDAWIVEAAQDISARTQCIQKSANVTLSTGVSEYATEDYTIKILGCIYISPDIGGESQGYIGLKRFDYSQTSNLPNMLAGPPQYYYRYSEDGTGKIGILPLPTTTENGQTLKVIYAVQTNTIAEIPQLLQSASFWYAASMGYRKEHRYAEANTMYEMYLEKIKSLSRDIYNVVPEVTTK